MKDPLVTTVGEGNPSVEAQSAAQSEPVTVTRVAICQLRSQYHGILAMHGFRVSSTGEEVLVLTIGNVEGSVDPLVRIHSRCLTGDVFGSVHCECGEQLTLALDKMRAEGLGVLIYLEQEGRGNGLLAKLKAYELHEMEGLDTVDANARLCVPLDSRSYQAAIFILRFFGINSIRLLTNNPGKIDELTRSGIMVTRESIEVSPNAWNQDYLRAKKLRMGHLLRLVD